MRSPTSNGSDASRAETRRRLRELALTGRLGRRPPGASRPTGVAEITRREPTDDPSPPQTRAAGETCPATDHPTETSE